MMSRGRRMYGKREDQGRYNPANTAQRYIWRPCVPSWEREFTSKIGNIKWEEFVEAKKWITLDMNVLEWNDSAGEEAFIAAKTRFWDHYHGNESQVSLPDPDMYIDKIDWTQDYPQENKEDEDPRLSISDVKDNIPESGVVNIPSIKMEDIKPTGWDVDVPQTSDLLTGFVVGDDVSEDGNVLGDSINIARESPALPALRKFRQFR